MNVPVYLFRSYSNKTSLETAEEIGLSVEEYEAIEAGIDNIDDEIAQKLSKIYKAPPALFLKNSLSQPSQIEYSHSSFNCSNGYVNNLYQLDMRIIHLLIASKAEEIQLLKEQIIQLRNQNNQLVSALIKEK